MTILPFEVVRRSAQPYITSGNVRLYYVNPKDREERSDFASPLLKFTRFSRSLFETVLSALNRDLSELMELVFHICDRINFATVPRTRAPIDSLFRSPQFSSPWRGGFLRVQISLVLAENSGEDL